MNGIRNIQTDLELVKLFLKKHTDHKFETATIRKGRKSTYVCVVENRFGEKVTNNFWFHNNGMISYGIVGWGVSSNVSIDSLKS